MTIAGPSNPVSQAFAQAAAKLVDLIPPAEMETCTGRIAKLIDDLEAGLPVTAS